MFRLSCIICKYENCPKSLPGTNTSAYYDATSVTKNKGFIKLSPGLIGSLLILERLKKKEIFFIIEHNDTRHNGLICDTQHDWYLAWMTFSITHSNFLNVMLSVEAPFIRQNYPNYPTIKLFMTVIFCRIKIS
jgi:hypothetical protein